MDRQTIRIGIVGAGANTRARHIPGLQAIAGIDIVAVCNRSLESGRKVADTFGISRVEPHWSAIVEAADIDAVVIGTWPYLHKPVTVAALDNGKHVLCEARMAMNQEEATAMLEAAERHPDLTAQLVPSPFSLHVDRTIQRILENDTLGQVVSVDVIDHRAGFPDPSEPMHWREDRALSGLNVLSLGIWYEALMRWLGTAASVSAVGATIIPARVDPQCGERRRIDIPDWLTVSGKLRCGAMLHMSLRSAGGLKPNRQAVITGTRGTLVFDGDTLALGTIDEDTLAPVDIPAEQKGHWRVERDFVDAIRESAPVTLTTFEDGWRYMAFTQAVEESRQSGALKTVPTA